MVNQKIVNRLLQNLEGYIRDLKSADDITYEKYMNDIRSQRFVERTLQIAIECCFDISHHIISDEGFRSPKSYAESFTVLAENGIIPMESVREYQMMAQFRNKIVHYYEKIEPEQVFVIFQKRLGTLEGFVRQVREWAENANH